MYTLSFKRTQCGQLGSLEEFRGVLFQTDVLTQHGLITMIISVHSVWCQVSYIRMVYLKFQQNGTCWSVGSQVCDKCLYLSVGPAGSVNYKVVHVLERVLDRRLWVISKRIIYKWVLYRWVVSEGWPLAFGRFLGVWESGRKTRERFTSGCLSCYLRVLSCLGVCNVFINSVAVLLNFHSFYV